MDGKKGRSKRVGRPKLLPFAHKGNVVIALLGTGVTSWEEYGNMIQNILPMKGDSIGINFRKFFADIIIQLWLDEELARQIPRLQGVLKYALYFIGQVIDQGSITNWKDWGEEIEKYIGKQGDVESKLKRLLVAGLYLMVKFPGDSETGASISSDGEILINTLDILKAIKESRTGTLEQVLPCFRNSVLYVNEGCPEEYWTYTRGIGWKNEGNIYEHEGTFTERYRAAMKKADEEE